MLIFEILFFVVLLQRLYFIQSYEYCKKGKEGKICIGEGLRHIACYKEQIKPASKYEKHYPMTDRFRRWLLYWHNKNRNDVACGTIKGSNGLLPSAKQMRQLDWDYELEYIAYLHASRCNMQHDRCRNSERIRISGQNLALQKTTGIPRKPLAETRLLVNLWFSEHADTPIEVIKSFKEVQGKVIGHFTVFVNDKVGRLGCAMTACTNFPEETAKYVSHHLTCNYDYTNVPGVSVYESGPSASNCKFYNVGKSSNFSCLCDRSFSVFE